MCFWTLETVVSELNCFLATNVKTTMHIYIYLYIKTLNILANFRKASTLWFELTLILGFFTLVEHFIHTCLIHTSIFSMAKCIRSNIHTHSYLAGQTTTSGSVSCTRLLWQPDWSSQESNCQPSD